MAWTARELVAHLGALSVHVGGLLEVLAVDVDAEAFVASADGSGVELIGAAGGITVVEEAHMPGPVTFHTDGLFSNSVPQFVALWCADPGQGSNPTVVADTRRVAARVIEDDRLLPLATAEVVWAGAGGREHVRPLLAVHPFTGEPILNLSSFGYLRPSSAAPRSTLRAFAAAQASLFDLLEQCVAITHHWTAGDFLVFDNYAYVHGRDCRAPDPARHLYRVWFNVHGPALERAPC